MCRIAGIIDFNSDPSELLLQKMTDAMKRGGPDDAGLYIDNALHAILGHRRLAIIDLSRNGHQPMISPDNNIVIVFNGEIYNYKEIREELKGIGIVFNTASDTEVIIHAYKTWGRACFSRFNGMFALAILDKRSNKIILARDHAGIKPLYYSLQNDRLYFASEIRAFKAINKDWPENPDWKKYFLLFGHLPEPVTTLQGVQPLDKGSCLEFDLTTRAIALTKFSSFQYNYTITSEDEAVQLIKEELPKAVQRHLISDAPIGLFLSGGLDSSLLTILAKQFVGDNLHTLSIDFDNPTYSERKFQEIIVRKTGAKHKSFIVTQNDFEQSLPDILEAMDQPSNDGINAYFICKYAKEYGLKAVLSGIGADELFGGYHSFSRYPLMKRMKWVPSFMLSVAEIAANDKWKRISFLKRKDGIGEYLFNRGFFVPSQIAELLGCTETEIERLLSGIVFPPEFNGSPSLERTCYYETNWYMQNQLLKDTDYMSMWHSIEVRVPFLDKDLMNAIYSIHPFTRYNRKQLKYLLIKAFAHELPEEIYKRTKQGFLFPFDKWMKTSANPFLIKQSQGNDMYRAFEEGKIHWSRYWSYILSRSFT